MKKILVLDLLFYFILPYFFWNYGIRWIWIDDYDALLLSTVPSVVYTIYRFLKEKQFNIAGLLVISTFAFVSSKVNNYLQENDFDFPVKSL